MEPATGWRDLADVLRNGANVLALDAELLRQQFHIVYDAADPIPGITEQKELVSILQTAADKPMHEQADYVVKNISRDQLARIARVAKGILGPSVSDDPAQLALRKRYGEQLLALYAAIKPLLVPDPSAADSKIRPLAGGGGKRMDSRSDEPELNGEA